MKFSYTAIDPQGQRSEGHIDAASSNQAAMSLSQQGLAPLSIQGQADVESPPNPRSGIKAPNPLDLQLFSQQMASMLKAGVPIMRALSAAAEGGDKNTMAPVANAIKADLQAGKPLAAAMANHPQCFDDYYLAMIRIGEATGSIDAIFKKLHGHLDFQRQMKAQVKAALRYPTFVIIVIAIALIVVNFFVIPAFAKVYKGFGADLPIFTKILVGTSNAMINYWWVFALLIVGVFFGVKTFLATTAGRLSWDEMKLRIPVAGRIAHQATIARFSQSLALAITAGLPISAGLALVGDTTDNAWLGMKIGKIKTQIERGENLYRACLASKAFTGATLQMILVGEESGTLDDMLLEIARLYQEQVEYDLKTIGAQLEPIMLIFLGGLVLVLALGIFLPIWGLSEAAFRK